MSHKRLVSTLLAAAIALPAVTISAPSAAKSTATRVEHRRATPKRGGHRKAVKKREEKREEKRPSRREAGASSARFATPPVSQKMAPLTPASVAPAVTRPAVTAPRVRRVVAHPPGDVEIALGSALQLNVVRAAPEEPWQVQISNVSNAPVLVATDPRLLWFEATVPGRKEPVTCRLPKSMLPTRLFASRPRRLGPAESFTFVVDPRMYCFDKGQPTTLLAGASLQPYYGWPEAVTQSWVNGKRAAVRLEQSAPYVALALGELPVVHEEDTEDEDEDTDESISEFDADDGDEDSEANHAGDGAVGTQTAGSSSSPPAAAGGTEQHASSEEPGGRGEAESVNPATFAPTTLDATHGGPPGPASATTEVDEEEEADPAGLPPLPRIGLKRIQGALFTLDSTYLGWARRSARAAGAEASAEQWVDPLQLEITSGSDALTPREVLVTVALKNVSDDPIRVHFRRDVVNFTVRGPDGESSCDADSAFQDLDPSGYLTIRAHGQESLTTRLFEFCDEEAFARPGFYYVGAHMLVQTAGGESERFSRPRHVMTERARPVRIQTAELPFKVRKRSFATQSGAPLPPPQVGAPPPEVQQVQQPAQPVPPPPPPPPPSE